MSERSGREWAERTLVFALGVLLMAFGVALSKVAGLGTSPISCLPAVLSNAYSVTIGVLTFGMNVIFVVLQKAVLRHDYSRFQLLQVPAVLCFGLAIDGCMLLLAGVTPGAYWLQWVYCIGSIFLLAFGVFLTVKADVVMMPGDALAAAIARRWQHPYAGVKVGFDVTMVILGAVCSLLLFGYLWDVREGTIAAAVCVGLLIRVYDRACGGWLDRHLSGCGGRMVSRI